MDDVFAGLEVVEVVEARPGVDGGVRVDVRFPLREDAVGFRDDDEVADLEAAGQVIEADDGRAASFGGGEMLVEPLARGVEELGVMRLVRAEFGKAGKGGCRKVVGRHARRRRIAGENNRIIEWSNGRMLILRQRPLSAVLCPLSFSCLLSGSCFVASFGSSFQQWPEGIFVVLQRENHRPRRQEIDEGCPHRTCSLLLTP